jgi:GTP cyclohydrolase I
MNKRKIEELTRQFLKEIGLDSSKEELKKTPERVASMFEEIFEGINKDPKKGINVYKTGVKDEVVLLKSIPFFSFCEDHIVPFFGKVHIAYIPKDGLITGFSSFVSIVKILSRRLQLQEKLTDEIADSVVDILHPEGVIVVTEARHLCIEMRGEKPPGTEVIISSVRGRMEEPSLKERVFSMMRG